MIQTDEIFAGDWFKSIHLLLPDTLMLLIGLLTHLCFIELPGHGTERQILNSTVNIINLHLQLCGTPTESSLVLLSQSFAVYSDHSLNCFCHMEQGQKKKSVKLKKLWKWSACILYVLCISGVITSSSHVGEAAGIWDEWHSRQTLRGLSGWVLVAHYCFHIKAVFNTN